MRVLVTGWFSTERGEITAGDLLSGRSVAAWLAGAGVPHDVAMAAGFRGAGDVDAAAVDPRRYTHVVFVCGPVASAQVERLLRPFAHCRRIAVGVSLTGEADGLFDDALPRDDDAGGARRPDLSLAGRPGATPVVGVILAHPQPEYGARQRHDEADRRVRALVRRAGVAPLPLDTRLDAEDELGCATAERFESLIARTDAVVTTRLHGLVLALRAGVPAVALDPIAGGAKVTRQAAALGWPAAADAERASDAELDELLRWCLGREARTTATRCAARGRAALSGTRDALLALLSPAA
jgi:Polysaccharide pyruvyl transferase